MFKYIKWELKNYFNKKQIWFIVIGIVYLLFAIIPLKDFGFISGLVKLAFMIIIWISLFGSFIIGTKKVVDTFSKKTFLLESMIPYPVKKILLSKYLLGIILNVMYSLIGILGFAILLIKGIGFDFLVDFIKLFMKEITLEYFLRGSIILILSSITFMSFVVFGYILGKVIKPSGKGNKALGVIIWILLFYTFAWLLDSINLGSTELVLDIVYIVISTGLFFITSWLIENKLEIYN